MDIHLLVNKTVFQGLKKLHLTNSDAHEAVNAEAHVKFYLSLGHLMGFETHVIKKLREKHVGYNYDMIKNAQFVLKSLRQGRE